MLDFFLFLNNVLAAKRDCIKLYHYYFPLNVINFFFWCIDGGANNSNYNDYNYDEDGSLTSVINMPRFLL
jgi:hypothetical protein